LINAWTARTVGTVTKISGNKVRVVLKLPICMPKGGKIVLSRRLGQKWRLVGYGIIV
jgi:translation initiation factor 2 subunit 3